MFRAQTIKQLTTSNTSSTPSTEVVLPSSSYQLPIQSDNYVNYITRRNTSQAALGKITRKRLCGITFYFSPDYFLICVPTAITLLLAGFNIGILWNDIGTIELIVLIILLCIAFLTSFILTCTDPGVYPRLNPNEEDPLDKELSLVYCRVCGIRRPPRTSHCYVCDVCVLEHDHHCKVIGCCVGIRSLRWFALYLGSVALASVIGLFWVIRFLLDNIIFPHQEDQSMTHPLASGAKDEAKGNHSLHSNSNDKSNPISMDGEHFGAIILFVFNISLVMTLGAMALLYLYLVCSSTTRREMQRKNSTGTVKHRFKLFYNLLHTIFPPPSMLESYIPGISDKTSVCLV
ncbi:unnamed protein product [Phytomonas sp. Hart1]|nr:unnamed protein product [Phytomonas sp. Hart1]|eukprot:CCW68777.1 unnamed protein product [Phytomonas sp. isolate Hart1]